MGCFGGLGLRSACHSLRFVLIIFLLVHSHLGSLCGGYLREGRSHYVRSLDVGPAASGRAFRGIFRSM